MKKFNYKKNNINYNSKNFLPKIGQAPPNYGLNEAISFFNLVIIILQVIITIDCAKPKICL